MGKIRITENQAKLLGLKKINEEENTGGDGIKSTKTVLGPRLRRIVISGEPLKNKFIMNAILSVIFRHDKESDAQYFEEVNKIVSKKTDEHSFSKIKRDLKSIDTGISVEPNIGGVGRSIETLKNGLVVDTAPSALKPMGTSKLKISKEQYNRIFASGLINEEMDQVDKQFKKSFANSDIENFGEGENFDIKKKNPSLPSSIQGKFGKPLMETDDELQKETRDLIKYFYRKSDQFSPFWDKYGLTYDDIQDALKSRGLVVTENGMCELSKKFGTPQETIQAVEEELKNLISDKEVMGEDGGLPAGVEYDSNAPWKDKNVSSPIKAKKELFSVMAYNSESAILKGMDGLYFFFYEHINKDEFIPYAEIESTYVGKDGEGQPEFELSDDWDINGEVISNYVNNNLDELSKGEGVDAWEDAIDLVKIDEPLKYELLKMYDKDKSFVKALSSLTEEDKRSVYDMLKTQIDKATTQKEKEPMTLEKATKMAEKFAELYDKPVEYFLTKIKAEYGLDETTSAASSGAFTGLFSASPVKKKIPVDTNDLDVPVVGETTTAASSGQYTAPAFKMKTPTEFSNEKPKAFKKTQYAKGGFVKFNDCVKLNNKPAGAGCSQGAVDNVVKVVQTKGNVNAPSLNEALKLQINKEKNELIVLSDLEGKSASQETFSNKNVLKQNGFKWNGTNWVISADKLATAKSTLSLINKAEYIIDKLEDLEDAIDSSDSDKKSLLKSKLEMYINDLANATDEKALSAEIRRYLTFFSKFHDYSFFNRLLIYIQKPDAKRVASYKKWQEKSRQVKKGAKAITILAPIVSKAKSNGEEKDDVDFTQDVRGFRAVNVFDISDTEATGPEGEVPETPQWWGENTPSETADELFKYVSEVASDMGITVTASDAKGGEKGFAAGDHINISSGVEGVGKLSTMIHEIAHELMHFKTKSIFYQDDEVRSSSALKELQAESVSYVVLKHYGLPVAHHTTYLALWKANKEKIQSNLEVISKVSQFIIDRIDEEAKRQEKETNKIEPQSV